MIKKIEIHNKKARFSYEIQHTLTAGIQLNGTEIKSIRNNEANIKDAYCIILENELCMSVPECENNAESSTLYPLTN